MKFDLFDSLASLGLRRSAVSFRKTKPQRKTSDSMYRRPRFESLEERQLLTAIQVTTNSDAAVHAGVSLRDAIGTANTDSANGVADTITFNAVMTITLTQGALTLNAGTGLITIQGGQQVSVSGNNASGVFVVNANANVSLIGLTVTSGKATNGAGVANSGTLLLSGDTVTSNTAANGNGGGISNSNTGNLTINLLSTITNNSGGNGGGIYNNGTMTISATTISANFSTSTGPLVDGGGIFNDSKGTLTVSNTVIQGNESLSTTGDAGGLDNILGGVVTLNGCTISANSATQDAGGVGNSGTMTINACTITGNGAGVSGGGIGNDSVLTVTDSTISNNGAAAGGGIGNAGTMTVSNTTLTGNSSTGVAAGTGGGATANDGTLTVANSTISANSAGETGGGIVVAAGAGITTTLLNTIVAKNTGPQADVSGAITAGTNNLIGDGTGMTGLVNGASGNLVGTTAAPINPLLETLANNGGTTQTMALLTGSPAINAAGKLTTTSAAIAAGDLTIKVANAAAIASSPGGYVIQIDSEQMTVTGVNLTTNTLTVSRGVAGTTAAAHNSGAAVYLAYDQRGLPRIGVNDIGAFEVQTSLGTTTLVEPAAAGSDTIQFALPGGTGAWTVTANNSWLHVSAGNAAGTGNATVLFTFDANPFPNARTGTLTVAGATLTVTQAGTKYVAVNPVLALVPTGLLQPISIAVDDLGDVFIADQAHNAIKEWVAATNTVSTVLSTGLNAPEGVAVDSSGNVYIADTGNKAIKEWNAQTQMVATLVATGLTSPDSVAVDDSGNVYFTDSGANTVKEWIAATSTVSTLVSTGLNAPADLALDVAGNVYISDQGNNAVKVWSATTHAVSALVSTGLNAPSGVEVDGSGNVYIADFNNNAIKERVAATAAVTTLLNVGLDTPSDVAVDSNGNVYIADYGNNAVKELARAYVGPMAQSDPLAGGTDSLLAVLPTTENLSAPFAPTSGSPAFLTIGTITGGVVDYNLTATGATRTANITLLGQTIVITQQSLFQQSGTTLTVLSNPNDENLQVDFTSATAFSVTLGGTTNNYTTPTVNKVVFAGADASATAVITDDFNTLTSAALTPTTMTVKAASYEVDVTSTPTNTVSGLAADTATLLGTTGVNQFDGKPAISELLNTDAGTTYIETADNVGTVNATSSSKSDVAYLYDNTGTNTLTASPTTANMTGTGYTYNATTFPVVYAIGSGANNDTAYLSDAAGGLFNGFPTSAVSYGTGYYNSASNFKVVFDTMASANNQAFLYDTSGANVFEYHAPSGGNPAYSVFYNPAGGFYNLVANSLQVTATAAAGTTDQAYLFDNTANSQLYGKPTSTLLSTSGTTNFLANNFGNVQTTETGTASTENAYMYDSTGADRFYGTPPGFGGSAVPASVVAGTGYSSVAIGFGQSYGISAGGGKDYAYLYDAAGNGTFYGGNTQSTLQGTGYYYTAQGFRYVFGLGAGGGDTAYFTDTVGGSFFEGHQPYSVLYNNTNLYVYASGFTSANATGNGNKKNDTAFLYDAPTNDYILALGDSAQLGYKLVGSNPTTVVNVAAFANVSATSSLGGTDKKFLSAVDYNLQVTGNWV